MESPLTSHFSIIHEKDEEVSTIGHCTTGHYLQGKLLTLPNCPHMNGLCPMADGQYCTPISNCHSCPKSNTFLSRLHGYIPEGQNCSVKAVAYDFYKVGTHDTCYMEVK